MIRRRVLTLFIVLLFLASPLAVISPIETVSPTVANPLDKIDETLLNMTLSEEQVDVLIKYDEEMGEFKARAALEMINSRVEIVESFKDLSMLRVKLIGKSIVDIAKTEVISRIWSNEIRPIRHISTESTLSTDESEYVSPVDVIGARDFWNLGYNGSGVVIAVLDTGIDILHSDFGGQVTTFASFVEIDSLPIDILGHGTYAASVAAGSGNQSDGLYAGIAPGATLLAGKVNLGGLLAVPSWIVSGIEWASSRGADIILLPFNTFGAPGDAVAEAVKAAAEKGILVIAAAGDDGPDYLTIMSPGGSSQALAVGAYDTENNEVPAWSGRGPSLEMLAKPDFVAPGVGVVGAKALSDMESMGVGGIDLGGLLGGTGGTGDLLGGLGGMLGGDFGEPVDGNDKYIIADSTTASAAIAAGAAAILLQAYHRATPIALANALRETAIPLAYDANDAGAGLLNLPGAFEYLGQRQNPSNPVNRTTGLPLIAIGILGSSAANASSSIMMSSFGTTVMVMDQRRDEEMNMHLMMGMFSLKWNNMNPTDFMMFTVKSALHPVVMASAEDSSSNYNRWIGILSYDEVFVTLLVESYNTTLITSDPVTGFKVTPFILNLGEAPISNVSLYVSYSPDLFLDEVDDHGKYSLSNEQLFAYGISEDYGDFYVGMNSSRPLDAFEVGNSADLSSHISDDNLTGSTTFDGSVGLGMKWDFGVLEPFVPANVTITMGFAENRTMLDKSIETLWSLGPPDSFIQQGDLVVVEADIPRVSSVGDIYESRAVIMNIGANSSPAIAAMLSIKGGLSDEGAIFARYHSFDEIKQFHVEIIESEWSPVEEGIHTVAWGAVTSIEAIISLLVQITSDPLSAIVGVLDDFIMRDVFVMIPVSSIAVFPNHLPFAPFDIVFPADFGIYTLTLYSTVGLGNLTVSQYGNASDWGDLTLTQMENVEGYYNMSLFLFAPPVTMDGYYRSDYVLTSEQGWTTNITMESTLRYPRAMLMLDSSHGGGFGSILGGGLSMDMGGLGGLDTGNDTGGLPGFPLAQDEDLLSGLDVGGLGDLGSIDELLESFRMTTLSGLSNLKKLMAAEGLDLVETGGAELDEDLLLQFSGILIFAPTEEFNSTDIAILRNYTAHGGKLVIFGDYEDRANHTALNDLLSEYGYSLHGEHSEENTTEIIQNTRLGKDLQCIWLGGGAFIDSNQSLASVTVNGNPVVLLDDTRPELALFGSSQIFMNKNLVKCNNSILLRNLNEFFLDNTLTAVASMSEEAVRYPAGRSVYLNLELTDYYGEPVDDLFVAIAFELPDDNLSFFIAGSVGDGLYSSQFLPSYWSDDGRINCIFIIFGENYASTFASVYFTLYRPEAPTPPEEQFRPLTMTQVALISSFGIFGTLLFALFFNRRRKAKRYRIPELDEDLMREIDNVMNTLLAAVKQIGELIEREDIDRVEKIEMLRGLMVGSERARELFERVSDRIGGV